MMNTIICRPTWSCNLCAHISAHSFQHPTGLAKINEPELSSQTLNIRWHLRLISLRSGYSYILVVYWEKLFSWVISCFLCDLFESRRMLATSLSAVRPLLRLIVNQRTPKLLKNETKKKRINSPVGLPLTQEKITKPKKTRNQSLVLSTRKTKFQKSHTKSSCRALSKCSSSKAFRIPFQSDASGHFVWSFKKPVFVS